MEAVQNSKSLEQKITGLLEKFPVILQLCRFVAIGVMNTALDFLILNYISKSFGITSGLKLGELNIIGFVLALIQSYFWNRYWAFNTEAISLLKNFIRLVLVGLLGGLTMILVLVAAKLSATGNIYLLLLVVYIIFQLILWAQFKLSSSMGNGNHSQFIAFLVVSIVGLLINSALIAVITHNVQLSANLDLNKNLAKIAATLASLVWNFIGYKVVVFKK